MVKSLRHLSRPERQRLLEAIAALPAGDIRRLHSHPGEWRLRVGDWRVRFRRDDAARLIDVVVVAPRGSAYKP